MILSSFGVFVLSVLLLFRLLIFVRFHNRLILWFFKSDFNFWYEFIFAGKALIILRLI